MTEPVVALVVAAGSGIRLGHDRPKVLVELAGVPLVRRSVEALADGGVTHTVVVAPAAHLDAMADALDGVGMPHLVVAGGARRQDSVRCGLDRARVWDEVRGATVVLVHDAARPLVPADVVAGVIEAVRAGHRAVVPAIAVVDTIRQVGSDEQSAVIDRAGLRAVQTPQAFDLDTLVTAHEALVVDDVDVTDDATACERLGVAVHLAAGSNDSLKITTPIDLAVAEVLLGHRAPTASRASHHTS